MKKRVTIKDVAREAGVSVATVSYVLNNRADIHITDKTRRKVLQIVNLLGYTPNRSAQALATNRKHMLACYMPSCTSLLKKAEQMYLIDFLSSFLHEKNYGLICLNDSYTEQYDSADAIVCFDISSQHFYQIGDRNFIPLLALDCFVSDSWLFFQINSNYQNMADTAREYFHGNDYTFVTLDTPNLEKKELFSSVFPSTAYVSDYRDLAAYAGQNILVVHETLRHMLLSLKQSDALLCYLPALSREKAEALFQCMEYALSRTSTVPHDVRI